MLFGYRILYGTTEYGGSGPACVNGYTGCGTVYSLTPPASAGETWTETVLYSFTGGTDGGDPGVGLAIGDGGVLYGAARIGGNAWCSNEGIKGCGVVFSLAPPSSPEGAWAQTVLYTFTGGADGASPNGVTFDKNGVLYGTTWGGGSGSCDLAAVPGCGTVYSLTPPASPGSAWSFQVLSEFSSASGPSNPLAGMLVSGGVLYGTSYYGGDLRFPGGLGTVFSLTPPKTLGGHWIQTVLHSFEGAEGDGANPSAAVVMGSGVLYGTTQNGGSGECSATGTGGCGAVFSLSPPTSPGGSWSEALFYSVNTFGRCSNLSLGLIEIAQFTTPGETVDGVTVGATTLDTGSATFAKITAAQINAGAFAEVLGGYASDGSCFVDFFQTSTATISAFPLAFQFTSLNAGPDVNLTGPDGTIAMPLSVNNNKDSYSVPVGSTFIPSSGGMFSFNNGSGGPDVGAFTASIQMPAPVDFSTGSLASVTRANGMTVNWSGGASGSEVAITGFSLSPVSSGSTTYNVGFFACRVPSSAGTFNVPASVLLSLPPSTTITENGISIPTSFLLLNSWAPLTTFTATGLDLGLVEAGSGDSGCQHITLIRWSNVSGGGQRLIVIAGGG